MVSQARWSDQAYGTKPDPIMAQYVNVIEDMRRSFLNRLAAKALKASKSVDEGQFDSIDIDEELKKLGG